MSNCLLRHGIRLAALLLTCLTCLGCFCTARDALPADQGERLKAVPEGSWLAIQPVEDSDEPVEEFRMNLVWDEAQRAYVGSDPSGEDPALLLIRFYSLNSPPYYAVLASNDPPVESDDCPAALFLARVQEGSLELVLPDKVDDAEHEALLSSCGVAMEEGVLSGSPENLKAYLLGLSAMGNMAVIQRYEYQPKQ